MIASIPLIRRLCYKPERIYWELNWKLQAEFITPQNLVAHDLIQHITVNGLRHAGGPVPSLPLHALKTLLPEILSGLSGANSKKLQVLISSQICDPQFTGKNRKI